MPSAIERGFSRRNVRHHDYFSTPEARPRRFWGNKGTEMNNVNFIGGQAPIADASLLVDSDMATYFAGILTRAFEKVI